MEIQYSSIQSIITHIVRDPNAQEKSIEQMDTIMAILNQDPRDMTVVMNTREGKSLLWTMLLDSWIRQLESNVRNWYYHAKKR